MIFTRKYNGPYADGKFVNKSGTLTTYSFHCGYVECYQSDSMIPYRVWIASPPFDTVSPEAEIKIYHEYSCYHVSIQFMGERGESTIYHYDTIGEARAKVAEIRRDYKNF